MELSKGELENSRFHGVEDELGLVFVRLTRGLGRKRILISKETISGSDQSPVNDSPPVKVSLKRLKNETNGESNKSILESLHQDILIRVLCHVDHEDIERLKRVSKTIRKAVLEAKKSHFDYSTPRKRLPFQDAFLSLDDDSSYDQEDYEVEPPNAPNQRRRNINRESDLLKISTVLFK